MHRHKALVLGISVGRCKKLMLDGDPEVVVLDSADDVAAHLWVEGDDVDVLVVSHDLAEQSDGRELVDIVELDWPRIKIIRTYEA